MLRRISIFALSVLLSSVFTLAGCQFASPTRTTTSTPAGGVLNLYGADPTTLDPATSAEANSIEYILQIYSGLVTLDKNMAPVADIARTWDVSPDGKTYTFHLRDDAKFQSSRVVTAQDFKYSWERACSPATHSSTASTYLGDILGANEMLAGKASELTGVKVIDDRTLQVTTSFYFKGADFGVLIIPAVNVARLAAFIVAAAVISVISTFINWLTTGK